MISCRWSFHPSPHVPCRATAATQSAPPPDHSNIAVRSLKPWTKWVKDGAMPLLLPKRTNFSVRFNNRKTVSVSPYSHRESHLWDIYRYIYIYLLFEWNQLMKCLLNSQIWKEIPFYQPSFWVPMSNFQGGPAQKNIQTIRVWWRMPFPIVLSFVLLNMRPGPASFFLLHFSFNDGLLAPKQKSLMWN